MVIMTERYQGWISMRQTCVFLHVRICANCENMPLPLFESNLKCASRYVVHVSWLGKMLYAHEVKVSYSVGQRAV